MLFVPECNNNKLYGINIEHKEESVFVPIAGNSKRFWSDVTRVFVATNALLKNLSEEEADTLFKMYKRVTHLSRHTRDITNVDELASDVREFIQIIFEVFPPEAISLWANNSYDDFAVPDNIEENVREGNYPESSTYNTTYYRDLCGLSTLLKLMLPITQGFIKAFNEFFETDFKEYAILRIMVECGLDKNPAYQKLIAQVADRCTKDGTIVVPMGLTLANIGEETYPIFMVATPIIRTLSISETDVYTHPNGQANNVAAVVSGALKQRIDGMSKKYDVRDTVGIRESNRMDAGNTSNQELPNSQQRFSDLYGIFFKKSLLSEGLPEELGVDRTIYNEFFKEAKELDIVTYEEAKMVICSLIFPNQMYVEAQTLVNSIGLKRFIAAAATWCHTRGYYSIVEYLMTQRADNIDLTEIERDKYVGAKVTMDSSLARQAAKSYSPLQGGGDQVKDGINEMATSICSKDYIRSTPRSLRPEYGVGDDFVLDIEFKNDMLRLIIEVGKL